MAAKPQQQPQKLGALGQARRRAKGDGAEPQDDSNLDMTGIVQELTDALAVNMSRVVDLFREWDDDASGTVDRREFRQALPLLGLNVSKQTADALFTAFDEDNSGEISYEELRTKLRDSLIKSAGVELEDALKPGAMGEIIMNAKNKIALRGGVLAADVSGGALGSTKLLTGPDAPPIAEQLRNALQKNLARVIDLFRDWDDNQDGSISKVEFRRAMPLLGLKVDRADADALFDSFEGDQSGSVDYGELQRQLKPKPTGLPKVRSAPNLARAAPPKSDKTGAEEYQAAVAAEQAAKRRLARIQKELMKSASESAIRAQKEQKLADARAVRHTTEEMKRDGQGMGAYDAEDNTPAASEVEVTELAIRLHRQMSSLFGQGQQRMWYKLYLIMDEDRSGRITYVALRTMIRSNKGLQINRAEMSENKIKSLWKALDVDRNGYIEAGEFGRFMKKGEDSNAAWTSAKQKMQHQRTTSNAALRKADDARAGKHDESAPAVVEPLREDELAELADQINVAMAQLVPSGSSVSFIKLFKLVDEDSSGKIDTSEFMRMVRVHLNLSRKEVSDRKIRGAWKAIESTSTGYLDVGGFGRFLRKGASAAAQQSTAPTAVEDETTRRRRAVEDAKTAAKLAAKEEDEERLREAGRRTAALARQIEMDAARLEAELKRVSSKPKPGKAGYTPLSGLRRQPLQASAPLESANDASSPLPMTAYPRPVRSHDVRSFDFLPRIGPGVDF